MATRKREGLFRRGRFWWIRTDPLTGGQTSTKQTTLEGARLWLRARERAAADPAAAAAQEARLGHWCDKIVKLKRRTATEKTVEFYVGKLQNVLEHFGRDFRLGDITPPAIDGYVAWRRGDGISDHTITKELSCLTQALKLAKRSSCYPADIAALRPLDLHASYQPRERALGREEVVRLLAALPPNRAAFVALAVGLGIRKSEVYRLTPADVDLERGRVFVGGTKTEESRRYLPILSVMRSLVEEGVKYLPIEPWENVIRDLEVACRRAGIQRCSPNDLRRSHATLLIEAGVDRDVVRRLLGHRDSSMVDRVYGRPTPEALGELAERSLRELPPIDAQHISHSVVETTAEPSEETADDTRIRLPKPSSVDTADPCDSAALECLERPEAACSAQALHAKLQQPDPAPPFSREAFECLNCGGPVRWGPLASRCGSCGERFHSGTQDDLYSLAEAAAAMGVLA